MSNSAIIPILFAVLQVTSAAPANSRSNNSTHQFQKRMATGSKIAIGICVPCVALVLGLGLWILWFYPEERRKLRERNARREIELAQKQRQGSEAGTLPVYQRHEGSSGDVAMNAPAVPAATAQPSPEYRAQAPTDARHAALAM